jgi:cell division protein FtsL
VPLRLVPSRNGQPGRIRQLLANRRRVLNIASVSIVVTSLLAVVVAQALLTNGQVRLSSLQHQLSLEQSAHRQAELAVSELETPPRIVSSATSQGMVRPANVVELPYVSLSVPVPTPNVTPAPAVAPPPAPTASTTTATSTP